MESGVEGGGGGGLSGTRGEGIGDDGVARRGARDGDDGDGEGGWCVGKFGVLRIMCYYVMV